MNKSLLFAPLGVLLLGARSVTAETPTSSTTLGAAPGTYAGVERRQERVQFSSRPERVQFSARIVDRRGRCNTIRSRGTGRLYSVEQADLRNFAPGTRVRVRGWLTGRSNCPHPLIRVSRIRRV